MKLRQLQCLCAVMDAGFNISRAGTHLHATQPAVGKQLRQLEEELGVDLLLRQGGRVVGLTEAGERTVAWARRALQCVQNIRAVGQESGGKTGGTIVLATGHAHANYVLLPAIVAFSRRFPRVRINVLQGTPDQVAELVRQGKVAFGVTHLPGELPKEIAAIPFLTSPRVLVVPVGHPLLKQKELTLEKLAAYPMIILHSARPQGARIARKFHEAGLDVNCAVQTLDADVAKTYVAAGLGIGIIPAFCYSARQDRGLRVRDVGHLFDPAVSAVLLRPQSHLQQYVYAFLESLDPALERRRLETLVLENG
jgi:LysR family cys regulon transcriptional activator